MKHIDLSQAGNARTEVSTQVCVVGAGPAGLVAALSLARRGYRVVVVESGARDDLAWAAKINEIDLTSHSGYGGASIGRKRGLGGTSELWGGRLVPLTRNDMKARDYFGVGAWPVSWDDVYAHIPEVERVFGVADPTTYEVGLFGAKASDALAGDPMVSLRSPKIVSFRKRNIYNVLAQDLIANPNVSIFANATVTTFKLDAERGTVIAVHATGQHGRVLSVQAKNFVIAAGTLESTRLLLHLDRQSNGRAFAGNSALGAHYVDHLALEVGNIGQVSPRAVAYFIGHRRHRGTRRAAHFELSPSAQEQARVGSAYLCLRLQIDSAQVAEMRQQLRHRPVDLLSTTGAVLSASPSAARAALWRIFHQQWLQPNFARLSAEIRIEQAPDARRRVLLSEQLDPLGIPKARLSWSVGDRDIQTLDAAEHIYRKFWRDKGPLEVCRIGWHANAGARLRRPEIRDVYHPSGSTRMGDDRHLAVVDRDLRCHNVPNVQVLSPSVFPSAGSANPMLTLICLAHRLAHGFRRC
jgi:choline dehydrogenase-like flavoprotein